MKRREVIGKFKRRYKRLSKNISYTYIAINQLKVEESVLSMPKRGTIFGSIKIDGKYYKMLSRPLDDETADKIHSYKKQNNGIFTSAPWLNDTYGWSIVDNKLYLNEIKIKIRFNNGEQITKKMPEVEKETLENDNSASIKVKPKSLKELFALLDDSSDRTLEEIGRVLNVTKERVSQLSSIDSKNIIKELFNTDKLFAEWQNKDIKLLLNQEAHNIKNDKTREKVTMNLRVLKFKDGVLISMHDEIEEFIHTSLKNYIEE